jgi:hypothetical protein
MGKPTLCEMSIAVRFRSTNPDKTMKSLLLLFRNFARNIDLNSLVILESFDELLDEEAIYELERTEESL